MPATEQRGDGPAANAAPDAGRCTRPFTDAVAEAERLVAGAPHVRTDQDLVEGMQYLAGCIASTLHGAWAPVRTHPVLMQGTGPYTKMGLDNPDTLYYGCAVEAGCEYIVSGRRGDAADISFQVIGGSYTDSEVPPSSLAFDDRELDIDSGGAFEVRFGPDEGRAAAERNYFALPEGSRQLVIREVYSDWGQARSPLSVRVRREDTAGTAPAPFTVADAHKRYERAGRALVQRVRTWLQFPEWFYLNLPVNTMSAPRLTPGGLATQYSSVGHYELAGDQAMIITVPRSDAPYQGFQLGSMWYISLDYVHHQTSLNNAQAQVDPDGMIRIVVSERDPGVVNRVETLGHERGYLQFRWQRTSREYTPDDGPTVAVVPFDDVAAHLPYYSQNTITADAYAERIALRQAQFAERMLG